MGWLRLAGSLKLEASLTKEPYKRDLYSAKRPVIVRSLLIEANGANVDEHGTRSTQILVRWLSRLQKKIRNSESLVPNEKNFHCVFKVLFSVFHMSALRGLLLWPTPVVSNALLFILD